MLESYGDMLSVEDVMEILGVGKNATYELFRTKEIQAFRLKIRKIWYFKCENIWLETS